MVIEARRSFECEVINKDGTGTDVTFQEGDTFDVNGLLYDDKNDTYDFEFDNGDKVEFIPGNYVH